MGLLSVAIWLPILVGGVLLALGRDEHAAAVRWIALLGAIAAFLVTIPLISGFDVTSADHAEVNKEAIDELVRRGAVRDGDLVIITKGDLMGVHGGTNAMKIIRVGEHEIIEQ